MATHGPHVNIQDAVAERLKASGVAQVMPDKRATVSEVRILPRPPFLRIDVERDTRIFRMPRHDVLVISLQTGAAPFQRPKEDVPSLPNKMTS